MVSEVSPAYLTLSECTSDGNISYGIVQPGPHYEQGVPVIRVNNVNNGNLDISSPIKVRPDIEEKHRRTRLVGGEILLTLVGSTGQTVIAGPELAGWNVARAIAVIRPSSEFSATWINICLQSDEVQHFLDTRANTTVQKTLNLKDVRNIPILNLPKEDRLFIEGYWDSINDKIELNRRMNATLEGMAQALFKSWFVDFDPVIDNALAAGNPIPEELAERAEVRRIALADGTANREAAKQFPAAFQLNEEMGWIPEGWACKQWGDIAKLEYGKSLTGYRDGEGTIPVFGTNGAIGHTDKAICNSDGIVIGRKGAYRGVHYSSVPFYVIDTAFYLVPKSHVSKKWAYYEILRFDINGMDSGSAIPSTSRDDFYSLWSTLPAPIAQSEFDRIISSFYERKALNNTVTASLTNLRDTLLPKLISGELRIPEAESLVEEALA